MSRSARSSVWRRRESFFIGLTFLIVPRGIADKLKEYMRLEEYTPEFPRDPRCLLSEAQGLAIPRAERGHCGLEPFGETEAAVLSCEAMPTHKTSFL